MERLIEQLCEILEAQASAYASFAGRLPLKLAMLREKQVDRLEKLTGRELHDVEALARLEQQRVHLFDKLAASLPDRPRTLRELLDRLGTRYPTQCFRLGKARDQLRTVLDVIQQGNQACETTIRRQLDFLDYALALFSSTILSSEVVYGHSGAEDTPQVLRLLDRRA